MTKSLVPEILSHLTRYLAQETSLEDFKGWFIGQTWDLTNRDVPGATTDLANEIDLALVEYSSGHLTGDELRELLGRLVRTVVIDTAGGRFKCSTSSTSMIKNLPYLGADTRHAEVPA